MPVDEVFARSLEPGEPLVEFAERLWSEAIKTSLSIRSHRNETRFVEDTQVTGNTRLVDSRLLNDVVDLTFALAKAFDNAATRRIGKSLKSV